LSRIKILKNQSFSREGIILFNLQWNRIEFSRDFVRVGLFESKIAGKAIEKANIETLFPLAMDKLTSFSPL